MNIALPFRRRREQREEIIAGIDEAGRGPLAGPVVAAVVVLRAGQRIRGVRDSKLLDSDERTRLDVRIRRSALDFGIGAASETEIDALNILQATMLAMSRAFGQLMPLPEPGRLRRVQVDGNRAPHLQGFPGRIETVIGGDLTCPAISAASILAKVHRDQLMIDLHGRYPEYGFDRHKGYATIEHRAALLQFGPCPAHRRSFEPVRNSAPGESPMDAFASLDLWSEA